MQPVLRLFSEAVWQTENNLVFTQCAFAVGVLGWCVAASAGPLSIDVTHARLSPHQRLEFRVRIKATAPISIALQDTAGKNWRATLQPKGSFVEQRVFALPGSYSLSVSAAGSTIHRRIRVPALRAEPLEGAAEDLPAIEFVSSTLDTADAWFLPDIQGQLRLPVHTQRTVHVHLFFDTRLDGRAESSILERRRNMSVLVPSLKLMTQLNVVDGAVDLTVLDSGLNKVTLTPAPAHDLPWQLLKNAITSANPATVSIADLQPAASPAGFLRNQAQSAVGDSATSVAVILSGAAPPDFSLGPSTFYIHYALAPLKPEHVKHVPSGMLIQPPPVFRFAETTAESDSTVFTVSTPEEFRAALARLIGAISRL